MSPPTYFPLRWESTGDQWWYASPIDWAAANGHYDLVRELLRIDANHLIKLTSLRRIRRLETVWDDDDQFHDVARCRSDVARNLLAECDAKKGRNSLVGSGYGGWLLYTAASAGDLAFVQELLARDPLLVFGEAEYGVTDILYAAARSKDSEVFRVILDFASSPRFSTEVQVGEIEVEIPSGYKLEITNRALHAAARGGNLRLMKELIYACSDNTLAYRDMQGATILHAAAARGQTEVVKYLVSAFSSILNSVDNEGNTALHVAAHRGHLAVVEALILASPDSINTRNNAGETFIHSIVSGFQTPGFRRLDRQIDLLKNLLRFDVENVINLRNNDGRTAIHLAITGNVHSDLVELLMTIRGIDVNIRDNNGMTPLDVLKRKPHSASSEILTRQLISAGGIFSSQDYSTRKVIASHIRRQSVGNSPGTSFRISDVEIFLYTGMENTSDVSNNYNQNRNYHSSEKPSLREDDSSNPRKPDKLKRLKRYLFSKMKKETVSERLKKLANESSERVQVSSLRERFSSNKRALSESPSPSAKKKVARIQTVKSRSSSSFSKLSFSSQTSLDTQKAGDIEREMTKAFNEDGPKSSTSSIHAKLMNPYLCFGGPAQHGENTNTIEAYDVYERSVLSAA